MEHVISRVIGDEFRIKINKPTPTLNPLSSIVFDKNIFVFIMIFMTLSFLRLIFYEEEM